MSGEALVVFTPSGRRGRFEHGTTALDAARRLGVDLDAVCGGRGICGRCQVEVSEGEHAKHGITCTGDALTSPTATELDYAADKGLGRGRRLGCVARVADDVVIVNIAGRRVLGRGDLEAAMRSALASRSPTCRPPSTSTTSAS